jgi:hypothetical protein
LIPLFTLFVKKKRQTIMKKNTTNYEEK